MEGSNDHLAVSWAFVEPIGFEVRTSVTVKYTVFDCNTVKFGQSQTFRSKTSPPSSILIRVHHNTYISFRHNGENIVLLAVYK
jgi:hypothetical protein